jgi:precorrin-6A/cobalt-precorrin-6A reductase
MIGLILGTSEGKEILSLLNKFTEDILISTATQYGGELLSSYKYKYLNTKPLDCEQLKELLTQHKVSVLLDASHPYATEVSNNCEKVCMELNIVYLRYERPGVAQKYRENKKVIFVSDYKELSNVINNIEELKGTGKVILNTTGSKNIPILLSLGIENRIVHRVLPSVEVMKQCLDNAVKIEDIVAIKGPIGYELNVGFIKQYNAKAVILKDSGVRGGTKEKIEAAIAQKIYVFIIERKNEQHQNTFKDECLLVNYIRENNLY